MCACMLLVSAEVIRKLQNVTANADYAQQVLQWVQERKIDRGASFNLLKALDRSLQVSFSKRLPDFGVPDDWIIRPLVVGERRFWNSKTRSHWVYNQDTGVAQVEMPGPPSQLPLMMIDCDKASTNMAATQFAMEVISLLLLVEYDEDHDDWNMVKLASNHTPWFPWRRGLASLRS